MRGDGIRVLQAEDDAVCLEARHPAQRVGNGNRADHGPTASTTASVRKTVGVPSLSLLLSRTTALSTWPP